MVMMILMVFTPVLFGALQFSAHTVTKADGQAMSEALAKTEMEFIKAQTYLTNVSWGYSITSPSGTRPRTGGPSVPAGYTVAVSTAMVPSGIVALVTNGGSGYTSPPAVSFTGGGGSGAAATANITK